ncbi:hypothetical protein FisN_2Lh116 [Fistulifera solaris]|uniref:RING-type domain-containing protein n=1 Tax=Fistulifera solaris TaxID=1519565 RepID=A0A1Z5JX79_FISSO|nr:hypothetical protein FisN_2Lh116 [Fistulifera solaris]|eukprot:GAX18462.1 hypothetical protein FisN_2Lh116 [Fistulifera solaris]
MRRTVIALISAVILKFASVEAYLYECRLPDAIIELQHDPVTDSYIIESNTVNNTNNKRRLSMEELENKSETNRARSCDCFSSYDVEPFYCPAQFQFCGASPSSASFGCFNASPYQDIASNVLFVASACVCAVFAWVLLSEPGKHVRNCVMSQVAPQWNDHIVSNLLRQYPERALHMMRLHLRYQTRDSQQEWILDANAVRQLMLDLDSPWLTNNKPEDGIRPVALKLKTCVYQSEKKKPAPTHVGDEEDSFDDCAICYQDLVNGDRVGALVCGHKFHSACLKEWCARRNACPLCNCKKIAAPQYQNNPQAIVADLRRNLRI